MMKTKTKSAGKSVEILMVEDNRGDVRLMREVLKDSKYPIHLSVVSDGIEAVSFLHRKRGYSHVPKPDLILMDLNLPRKSGLAVLEHIKQDSSLKNIPVLVLTSSHDDLDMVAAYHSHANFYIVKPMDLDHFAVVMKYIDDFWIRTMEFHAAS